MAKFVDLFDIKACQILIGREQKRYVSIKEAYDKILKGKIELPKR